ncbi:hypothetical protein MNB_SV-15-472 [hydrothermal vent metagenome]|uniref:Uncharacterized protein n=1 Tax=hydrothermal vent metagenome TaxID=652676 RepID=A0A1W1EIY4_9ZZZZ
MKNKSYLGGLISLLLGLTIGLSLITAIYIFLIYFQAHIIQAIIYSLFSTLPGLLIIVVLEFIIISIDENKKQTKLLEDILKKLDD